MKTSYSMKNRLTMDRKPNYKFAVLLIILFVVCVPTMAQALQAALPSAPMPQSSPSQSGTAMPNAPQAVQPKTSASLPVPPGARTLTLKEAEDYAVKNNPQTTAARLIALASQQVTRQVRSNLWPTAVADLTAVDAHPNSRITAGGLNNPIIYERAAVGTTVSQLITDFGRTTSLVASSNLAAKAEDQNAVATKEQVLLAVDQAFYSGLQANAVLQVAQQTVQDRQTVVNQVDALFKSKLKSQIDLSFANVNLAQAKLLMLDAENNQQSAMASLSAILGYPTLQNFVLVEDTTPLTTPPGNVDELINEAMLKRPEILALDYQYQSAKKFQTAERDLFFPTIRALAAVGDTPVRVPQITTNWYGAAGVNMDIPLFNGFLYSARAREANLRAQASRDRLLDLRNRISRDVRTSWLNATTAYSRLSVTQQLTEQANLALNLAQARYNLGLGSIVEFSQAQLQQTQAQISNTQAGYDYRLALAVLRFQTTGL